MNYLAHLYLSGSDEDVLIGNFIGDYVKGRKFKKYDDRIRKGIMLHRNIDMFTDNHVIVRASKSRFASKYHKYAGILVDIFYDHFLTKNWEKYSSTELNDFVSWVHGILNRNFSKLPAKVKDFVPSFIKRNWIGAYGTIEGLELVLKKMSKRTSLPDHTNFAIETLRAEYEFMDEEFMNYFPTLTEFVTNKFGIIPDKKLSGPLRA